MVTSDYISRGTTDSNVWSKTKAIFLSNVHAHYLIENLTDLFGQRLQVLLADEFAEPETILAAFLLPMIKTSSNAGSDMGADTAQTDEKLAIQIKAIRMRRIA